MGWLSRTFRSGDDTTASVPATPQATPAGAPGQSGPPVPVAPQPVPDHPLGAAVPSEGSSGTSGHYGPLVAVTHFDTAPPELEWQLPLNGELYRLMPGSDRPDYSLFVLERPVHFYPGNGFDLARVEREQRVEDRKGRPMVRVHALLLCARFVGQQLHPGMRDLAVNLAYVIDNSLARDAEVDFGKIEFAAVGFLSEGHAPRPAAGTPTGRPEPTGRSTPTPTPTPTRTPDADTAAPAQPGHTPDPAEPHTAGHTTVAADAPQDGGGTDAVGALLDEFAVVLRRASRPSAASP